jgi:hypothetical protein
MKPSIVTFKFLEEKSDCPVKNTRWSGKVESSKGKKVKSSGSSSSDIYASGSSKRFESSESINTGSNSKNKINSHVMQEIND